MDDLSLGTRLGFNVKDIGPSHGGLVNLPKNLVEKISSTTISNDLFSHLLNQVSSLALHISIKSIT